MNRHRILEVAGIVQAWQPPGDVSVTAAVDGREHARSVPVVMRSLAGDEVEMFLIDLSESQIETILGIGVKALRKLAYERTVGKGVTVRVGETWN